MFCHIATWILATSHVHQILAAHNQSVLAEKAVIVNNSELKRHLYKLQQIT
jgi:hypothetical protein